VQYLQEEIVCINSLNCVRREVTIKLVFSIKRGAPIY
jgi:hypothetical protein